MGQKVNPISLRLGIHEPWRSRWYADKKQFGTLLVADHRIRNHIRSRYAAVGIPRIDIERTSGQARIILHCARPAAIIGHKGQEIERLRGELEEMTGCRIRLDVEEVKRPEIEPSLIGESIAEQLQKRASYRRAMKKAADTAMQAHALGVKIELSGRLGGAEMRRRERVVLGMIPLHTLDAIIDYGYTMCRTTYGCIGIKVWIYRGDRRKQKATAAAGAAPAPQPDAPAGGPN